MTPEEKQSIIDARWRVCAFHYLRTTRDGAVIANLARVSLRKLYRYSLTDNWIEDIRFWHPNYKGDGALEGGYFLYSVQQQLANRIRKRKETRVRKRERAALGDGVPAETLEDGVPVNTLSHAEQKSFKSVLYQEQAGICNGCNVYFPFRNLTLDHIHPKSKGGADTPENLQLLCTECNGRKGSESHAALIQRLRLEGVLPYKEATNE